MNLDSLREQYREPILNIAKQHGVSEVRVFGSILHSDLKEGSDIDFLVDLLPTTSLLDLSELRIELSSMLDRKADVVPKESLHWYIKDQVLGEAELL